MRSAGCANVAHRNVRTGASGVSGSTPRFTAALQREYEALFQTCVIASARHAEVDRTVGYMVRGQVRYASACVGTAIPWQFAAIVHQLESSGDFTRHLHNGDPLRARTVRVPRGRPAKGTPPFAWEESAADALRLQALQRVEHWSLGQALYRLERYNGFGYRLHHPSVLSPYLWAGSNHYTRGKYVRDGRWSATSVSTQLGGAVLLRRMAELGIADFAVAAVPLVVEFHARRPARLSVRAAALALQRWLNTHPGVFVREDGWPGPLTAEAYRRVTGTFLPGDPSATPVRG